MRTLIFAVVMLAAAAASEAARAGVDYGPLSHTGLNSADTLAGRASTSPRFGGTCRSAGPGFDEATGLGSPLADQVASPLR